MQFPTKAITNFLLIATTFAMSSARLSADNNSNIDDVMSSSSQQAYDDVPMQQGGAAGASFHAMAPNPNPYQVTYEDGTVSPSIHLRVEGQNTASPLMYEETLDGFTVKPAEEDGKYHYIDVDDITGEYIDTGLVAGVDDPYSAHVHKEAAVRRQMIMKKNSSKKKKEEDPVSSDNDADNDKNNRSLHDQHHQSRRTVITSGILKNLVIPFKFADHTSRPLPSRSDLDILMNNAGPHHLCPTGSVRDVYLENSFDQLDLQSTVIDWVTLDYTEAYCSDGQHGLTTRIFTCLMNALDKAVAAGVDFADFDLDNDNLIDGMTFFHSGYAAEWGETDSYGAYYPNRIWSHKSSIYTTSWSHNGVEVSEYHINPALWYISGSNIGRIGVVAHETGHFLGLPDLYDYGNAIYGNGEGIGSYGLMGNSWGFDNSQYYPPHMSAWTKYVLGWVTPTVASTSGSYSLQQACDFPSMIRIDAGYPSGEYLLIENRQPCGFELAMGQGGLAIFHIDENANDIRGYPSQSGWPTNGNHYKVALLQADGNYDLEKGPYRGDSYDLFHGGNVDSIGPYGTGSGSLHPNTKAYQNGNIIDTEVTVSNISGAGSTMTFDIAIGSGPPTSSPVQSPVNYIEVTSADCESHGYETIASIGECSAAAAEVGRTVVWGPYSGYMDVVTGCSAQYATSTTFLYFNQPGVCDPNYNVGGWYYTGCQCTSWAPCICKVPSSISTSSPTEAPVPAPTVAPTAAPTEAPVASSPTCNDSPLQFKYGGSFVTCPWVASMNLCSEPSLAATCPATCGTCSNCVNSNLRFKFWNPDVGRTQTRRCSFVQYDLEARCGYPGIAETCRSTCGNC